MPPNTESSRVINSESNLRISFFRPRLCCKGVGSPHKDDEKKYQYGVESDFTILKFGINLFKVNESKATLASVCIDFCH